MNTAKLKAAASLALDAWNKFISLPDDVDLERGLSLHEMSLLSAHDAASNPATVLELIAALEAAEKRNAELEACVSNLQVNRPVVYGDGFYDGYWKARSEQSMSSEDENHG
ncbi:hypothetical protein C5942_20450 [Cronobacter sakazakii]|uniref:hypothetical protein n=1 Tax=Cronobacter sakazakii TaxID=28141 RepID=UPI000CFB1CCE|nr:hypothetical protein [Cronobacter sakazakii]PQY57187.1 hypothetical protein C5942_20450 [Cronobacter sakazakii]